MSENTKKKIKKIQDLLEKEEAYDERVAEYSDGTETYYNRMITNEILKVIKTMNYHEMKKFYNAMLEWGKKDVSNYYSRGGEEVMDFIIYPIILELPKYDKHRKMFETIFGHRAIDKPDVKLNYGSRICHAKNRYRKQKTKATFRSGASQADNLIRNINRISINTNKKFR